MNLNGFVKLTVDDVVWYTDAEGEPQWKPKHPKPGERYYLQLPRVEGSFIGEPLFMALRKKKA